MKKRYLIGAGIITLLGATVLTLKLRKKAAKENIEMGEIIPIVDPADFPFVNSSDFINNTPASWVLKVFNRRNTIKENYPGLKFVSYDKLDNTIICSLDNAEYKIMIHEKVNEVVISYYREGTLVVNTIKEDEELV